MSNNENNQAVNALADFLQNHLSTKNNLNVAKLPGEIRLGGFDADKAKIWDDWLEDYEWFKICSDLKSLPAEKQVATLMSCLGSEVKDLFKSFNLTAEQKKDHDFIVSKFTAAFKPTLNTTLATFEFFKIKQESEETFNEFYSKLQGAAKQCKFNENLEEMSCEERLIRDKIVLGVKSDEVRKMLLSDSKLSLNKAINICRTSEYLTQQTKQLMTKQEPQCDMAEFKNNKVNCKRCGKMHMYGLKFCPAKNFKCEKCDIKGHYTLRCLTKRKGEFKKEVNAAETFAEEYQDQDYNFYVNTISHIDEKANDDWYEAAEINGQTVEFKLDTGAQCNIIPADIVRNTFGEIKPSSVKYIISFNGSKTPVVGKCALRCKFRNVEAFVQFQVVDFNACPILGKNSCLHLGFVKRAETIDVDSTIFEGLGCLQNFEYKLDFVPNPVFEIKPARQIPYRIRQVVREELEKMVKLGVIRKQQAPTPVVSNMVVVRKNNKIRLCLDPTDLNKCLLRRHFPLRTIDEISANIAGSSWFTILDCQKGFWQIKMHPSSQKYLTFSTPWGRYSYLRLPFGLSTAPEIFQSQISQLLDDIAQVEVSMDDILIHADSKDNLNSITKTVLERLFNSGLRLNKDKCLFNQRTVKFLGHIVSDKGLLPDPSKVVAIQNIRSPENKKSLQRFLGAVNYLGKFIDNLSELTHPLRTLLQKEVIFQWESQQEEAFSKIKKKLEELPLLRYYDVNKDNVLSADCSSHSMGAVLFQDGYPVAYASKSLTPAQRNYPQIEKEALALRFACTKFHAYIFGKRLVLETDHKPLESIFKKSLDKAPPRLKRLILDVQPYNPTVVYKKGLSIPIPDLLSRDVLNEHSEEIGTELEVNSIVSMSSRTADEIRNCLNNDDAMKELISVIQSGWPENSKFLNSTLRPFWNFRDELSFFDGLVWKGDRIFIPCALRKEILHQIHRGHLSTESCLKRAKQVVFWVNMANDIEKFGKECKTCLKFQQSNRKEPLKLRSVPEYPFQVVASDIFTYQSKDYVVLVDSYSGWLDFKELKSMHAGETISHLKNWFSIMGIPEEFQSDNATQYESREFHRFMKEFDFCKKPSSPYYPQSNGLAERAVQTAKSILKKCKDDNSSIELALLNFRNIPRNDVLKSPNERILSRVTRSPLPCANHLLHPHVLKGVTEKLQKERDMQKISFDKKAGKERPHYSINDKVMVQDPTTKIWQPGIVSGLTSFPRSFMVTLSNGKTYRRSTKHLKVLPMSVPFKLPEYVMLPQVELNENVSSTQQETNQNFHQAENLFLQADQNPPPEDLLFERLAEESTEEEYFTPTQPLLRTRYGRVSKPVKRFQI